MNKILLLLLLALFYSCSGQEKEKKNPIKYPRWIGDIAKNNLDNKNFQICNDKNNVRQYFNNSKGLEYFGEKKELIKIFNSEFKPLNKKNQNGIIRIRFIVNCKGETGWFRILEADNQYKKISFDKKLTTQLLNITKNLKGWNVKTYRDKEIDYYQYISFKIVNGNIKEILP